MLELLHILFISYSCISLCESDKYPRVIWIYWEGRATSFVRTLIQNTTTALQERWVINVLTPANLSQYFSLDNSPRSILSCYPQLKANYIRLKLLEKYGGWWMDASTLVTSSNYFEKLYMQAVSSEADFLGFCFPLCQKNQYIENGMMYAPKGSKLIHFWAQQMEVMFRIGIRNYILSMYRNGTDITDKIFTPRFKYPTIKTYFIAYVCAIVAQTRLIPRHTTIITYDIVQTLYSLQQRCKWNRSCFESEFRLNPHSAQYPIIKLTKDRRAILDPEYVKVHRDVYDFQPVTLGIKIDRRINNSGWIHCLYHLFSFLFFLHRIQFIFPGVSYVRYRHFRST